MSGLRCRVGLNVFYSSNVYCSRCCVHRELSRFTRGSMVHRGSQFLWRCRRFTARTLCVHFLSNYGFHMQQILLFLMPYKYHICIHLLEIIFLFILLFISKYFHKIHFCHFRFLKRTSARFATPFCSSIDQNTYDKYNVKNISIVYALKNILDFNSRLIISRSFGNVV